VGISVLSFEDILELSVEQLKVELESWYLEATGISKPQIEKALIKSLSLEAPVATQQQRYQFSRSNSKWNSRF